MTNLRYRIGEFHPIAIKYNYGRLADELARIYDDIKNNYIYDGAGVVIKMGDHKELKNIPGVAFPLVLRSDMKLNPYPNPKPNIYLIPSVKDESFIELFETACVLDVAFNSTTNPLKTTIFTDLPVKAFAVWIAKKLSVRYDLTLLDELRLGIVCAIWHMAKVYGTDTLLKDKSEALFRILSSALNAKREMVIDILEQTDAELLDGHDITPLLKSTIGTLPESLDKNVLFAQLQRDVGSVFSPGIVESCIYNPPMFIGLLYTTINGMSFKFSNFAKIVKAHVLVGSVGDQKEAFVKAVDRQVKSINTSSRI